MLLRAGTGKSLRSMSPGTLEAVRISECSSRRCPEQTAGTCAR